MATTAGCTRLRIPWMSRVLAKRLVLRPNVTTCGAGESWRVAYTMPPPTSAPTTAPTSAATTEVWRGPGRGSADGANGRAGVAAGGGSYGGSAVGAVASGRGWVGS